MSLSRITAAGAKAKQWDRYYTFWPEKEIKKMLLCLKYNVFWKTPKQFPNATKNLRINALWNAGRWWSGLLWRREIEHNPKILPKDINWRNGTLNKKKTCCNVKGTVFEPPQPTGNQGCYCVSVIQSFYVDYRACKPKISESTEAS